jgi:predicted O-methyltransferase YrrM
MGEARTKTGAPVGPSPQTVLAQMINGYWLTGSIHAAARLGIADQLAAGPQSVPALSKAVGAHGPSLLRLLRALAAVGIFAEGERGHFSQTPLSEALRTGVPGSMHGLATMTGILHLRAWPEIVHSVRTGETAFSKAFGKEIFAHVSADAEAGRAFDEAMAGYTAVTSNAVVAAYDFSSFETIVDVGGGNGALLSALLEKYPKARGVTFDLPSASERAREHLRTAGMADRCEVVAGDFFASVPAGGDAYTMKMIVHDWDDRKSIAILENVRKAIRPDGRVLLMEAVLEPGNGVGAPGKLLDINMLVMTGGRERTAAEYGDLLRASGFELVRVVGANPQISVIEGKPV